MPFTPEHPGYAEAVRASFARQQLMRTLGVEIEVLEPGRVVLGFGHRSDLTQQHGVLHAGVLTAVVDSACGYAALTLMPAGAEVVSVEFKVNFLRPASATRFVADGRVRRCGRSLSVCEGEVRALDEGSDPEGARPVALMLATMMRVAPA